MQQRKAKTDIFPKRQENTGVGEAFLKSGRDSF